MRLFPGPKSSIRREPPVLCWRQNGKGNDKVIDETLQGLGSDRYQDHNGFGEKMFLQLRP